jgi:hypothetical protein
LTPHFFTIVRQSILIPPPLAGDKIITKLHLVI